MHSFKGNSRKDEFLNRLRKFVLENLENENFGVEDLAQKAGTSRSNLHRKLKKLQKKSVSQFIREIRLEKALEMLRRDEATVSEIAYKVGFSSPSYFNTCFREYYGYPPGETKFRLKEEEVLRQREAVPENKSRNERFIIAIVLLGIMLISAIIFSDRSFYSQTNESTETFEKKTIAILPFNIEGDNEKNKRISAAMTEAIIDKLQKIGSIESVIPYSAIKDLEVTDSEISGLAKKWQVRNIVVGDLKYTEGNISIHLEAWDSETGNKSWEEDYLGEWKVPELFAVQNEIAKDLANFMDAEIEFKESEDIKNIPTFNQEAYEAYIAAEYLYNHNTSGDFEKAKELFNRAILLDPSFIQGYIGLAKVWIIGGLVMGLYEQKEAWAKAKPLLMKAKNLEPENDDVIHTLYTGYFYFEWNFEKMEEYFQKYKEYPGKGKSNAGISDYAMRKGLYASLLSDFAVKTGRYEMALSFIDIAYGDKPGNIVHYEKRAEILMFSGKILEANDNLKTGDALFKYNRYYLGQSAKIHHYLGDTQAVRRQIKRMSEIGININPLNLWLYSMHPDLGGLEESKDYISKMEELYEANASGSPAWFIALYYAGENNKEMTFEWLRKSYKRHEVEMTWLREEPMLIPFRKEKEYLELYEAMNFPVPPPDENSHLEIGGV